jgi:glucose/arabinose dehydrogenase
MKNLILLPFIMVSILSGSCGHKNIQDSSRVKAAINYNKYCASCHYTDLGWFKNRQWKHGNTEENIVTSIKTGFPDYGMPSFDSTLSDEDIQNLAKYILVSLGSKGSTPVGTGQIYNTEKMKIQLEPVIKDLESPWGLAFLPNGDMLVSERIGRITRFSNGTKVGEIQGLPEIHVDGQGGLFEVKLHPDFKNNNLIYFAYNSPSGDGWNTAVMRARLQDNSLTNQQVIFKAVPDTKSNIQFGGRIAFDGNGHLFIAVGDRGDQNEAQDLSNDCGKIHRVNDDGSIPSDNPFVNQSDARPSIWCYGQRNQEGLAFQPSTGVLWEHEHGPMGGDELNIIGKGKNYGWPVITYGKNYDGTTITNETSRPGMEQPVTYWDPSIAPSGLDFVTGSNYKPWAGNILLGALKFKYLVRCELSGNSVSHQEIMFKDIGRLRNVVMGPDGYVYIATELPGTIYKLIPVQ